jgi:hypothetical protein
VPQPGAPGSHFEPGSFDFSLLLDFFLYAHRHVSAPHRVQQSFPVITTKRKEVKIIAANIYLPWQVYTPWRAALQMLRHNKGPEAINFDVDSCRSFNSYS